MVGMVIVCADFLSGLGGWLEAFFKTRCFEEDKTEKQKGGDNSANIKPEKSGCKAAKAD